MRVGTKLEKIPELRPRIPDTGLLGTASGTHALPDDNPAIRARVCKPASRNVTLVTESPAPFARKRFVIGCPGSPRQMNRYG